MSAVFESIISGEWAGRFVWTDDLCVAFATIEPTTLDHVLAIPRHVYERWTDIPASIVAHLMEVVHTIGAIQERGLDVPRSGLVIAGFEVPHTHLHVTLLRSEANALLSSAAPASDEAPDGTMGELRGGLRATGYSANVPLEMSSPTLA